MPDPNVTLTRALEAVAEHGRVHGHAAAADDVLQAAQRRRRHKNAALAGAGVLTLLVGALVVGYGGSSTELAVIDPAATSSSTPTATSSSSATATSSTPAPSVVPDEALLQASDEAVLAVVPKPEVDVMAGPLTFTDEQLCNGVMRLSGVSGSSVVVRDAEAQEELGGAIFQMVLALDSVNSAGSALQELRTSEKCPQPAARRLAGKTTDLGFDAGDDSWAVRSVSGDAENQMVAYLAGIRVGSLVTLVRIGADDARVTDAVALATLDAVADRMERVGR